MKQTTCGEPVRFLSVSSYPAWFTSQAYRDACPPHSFFTAFVLMAIVGLHVLGALKNHFVDRNNVLRKMLGLAPHPVKASPAAFAELIQFSVEGATTQSTVRPSSVVC